LIVGQPHFAFCSQQEAQANIPCIVISILLSISSSCDDLIYAFRCLLSESSASQHSLHFHLASSSRAMPGSIDQD
jgi:hypothetical protein